MIRHEVCSSVIRILRDYPVIDIGSEFAIRIFTMAKTTFILMFGILFATFVFAQTEEPDWQDVGTHVLDLEGTKFPKEAAEGVLKAVLYGKRTNGDILIEVTNFVEFCDDLHDKRCFAAALYTVDPTPEGSPIQDCMDQIQFLVWLERISDVRYEYIKLWEQHTGGGIVSGSLSVVDSTAVPVVTPCLLVKTSAGGNGQSIEMKMLCRGNRDWPEIVWEYSGDYWGTSTGQGFRKSILSFKDVDNDHINELVVDTVEGYIAGWDDGTGDGSFKITKQRSMFRYENEKFVAITPIPSN